MTVPQVDLHLHSTASDGELAPPAVVRRAVEAGLVAISLTDHDTVAGVPAAMAAAVEHGLRVVSGCEFSVQAPWGEMHVIGYFLPPSSTELENFLVACRTDRERRVGEMVARLQSLGLTVTVDEVAQQSAGGAMGRPHVARALVRRGDVNTVDAAFDRFLGRGRPAYVSKALPTFATVAALVHRLGGVIAAAHLKDRGTRALLAQLKTEGLDAVETRHPSHDGETRARLTDLALQLGLARTGGSDWHGEADAGWSHGALGSQEVPLEWLERLESQRPTAETPC